MKIPNNGFCWAAPLIADDVKRWLHLSDCVTVIRFAQIYLVRNSKL